MPLGAEPTVAEALFRISEEGTIVGASSVFTARVLEPLGLADSFEARSKALAEAHRMRMRRSREACASGAELHPKAEVL